MSEVEESEAEKRYDKESLKNVLVVAISVCLLCSIVVSTAAVMLKPQQVANQKNDQRENILRAAGMLPEGANVDASGRDVAELFKEFEVRAVDLRTGKFTDAVNPETFDPIEAAKDPSKSVDVPESEDIATIGRRENISKVYIHRNDAGKIDRVVMPVRGYGLWGTLYGYMALKGDLETIAGLGFYSQKETPGLGGEVDNPKWKAQWPGVQLYSKDGDVAVKLVKNRAPAGSPEAAYQVDALSGATLTTRGVQHLVQYWMGPHGFGPFLENLSKSAA